MKLTGLARREWNRLLASAFWLRETEASAIADRCLCVQRLQEAETDIRKRGMIVRGSESDVLNPSVRIARAYRASLHPWDAELGLTPSSRTSLQLPSAPEDAMSPLERALCGLDYDPIERKLRV